MKKRLPYIISFFVLLAVEIFIGVFIHDRIIRPYAGDVLIVILLCCLVRSFAPVKPKYLAIWMALLGLAAEVLQLLRFAERLGLEGTVLGVILGSTFDLADILCYLIGGFLFLTVEWLVRPKAAEPKIK